MNTLYLHVGPHKTGTTLIQKFLLDNQSHLFKKNVVYPKRFQKIFGHHEFRELIAERKLTQEIVDFFDEEHDFILSSEDFISLNKDDFSYLKDSIKSKNIVVLFSWRRASFKLYSIWQEVIKHGGTESFFSYYHEHLARPGASQMLSADLKLNMFSNVFGLRNIRILDYDASADNNSLLQDFISLTGMSWQPGFVTPEQNADAVNRSMDITDIEIIRALNQRFKVLFDIHGAEVRNQYAKHVASLDDCGLTELKAIVESYIQILNVGNYFIDVRCESIIVEKFKENILNYKPNTRIKTLRIAQPDWMLEPKAQDILQHITQKLKTVIEQ
ncbi:hypothetical protein [Neptunicella marina]|uniref:Sulfotransferase domain-containing protein n=1 Tax=Neptunicella marina TaxID=2125989 RepID=A0A8J6IRE8_9ALTE|nr:hypothetical protein [Neptunicella marina]MBC3764924.1 hypothetical protein [Neptunicella marina]